jgi:autotransporter-associated beta strand protein
LSSAILENKTCLPIAMLVIAGFATSADAVPRTWIGGNVDWVDGIGNNANWTQSDEPDLDDEAVFNTPNTVNLGSGNLVNGLTLSGGIDLNTATFLLTVDGLASLTGSGTSLTIPTSGSLLPDSVSISSSSVLSLQGGFVGMSEEAGDGLFDINAAGTLSGFGTVTLSDIPAAVTSLITNDGTISASRSPLIIFGEPAAGTLTITATTGLNARIDLDGTTEGGTVNVFRNQTLDINGNLSDAFSGTMNLYHNSHIVLDSAMTLGAGVINVDNGLIDNPIPTPDVPAGTAYFNGALTQTGGTINVIDTDGQLKLNVFNMTGGDFVNNGLVIFNLASATIGVGANFTMPGSTSSLTLMPNVTVTVNQADFNADGGGASTNVITLESGSLLDLNLGVGADNSIGSRLELNGGTLAVTYSPTNAWFIDRQINANSGTSTITGDPVTISSAVVQTFGGGTLIFSNPSTWTTSTLNSTGLTQLSTATFTGTGTFQGTGTLRLQGTSTFSGNTTVNTSTFDWDGTTLGHTLRVTDGVTLTINSTNVENFNESLQVGGNAAALMVNGPASWNMQGTLTTNSSAVGVATVGGTSRLVLDGGTMLVTGDTTVSSPITFGSSSTTTVSPGATLTVNGSTIFDGGTVTGTGRFDPAGANTVNSSSTISVTNFNFDRGNWTVNNGATLAVTVGDYDPDVAVNAFGSSILLNSSHISVNTGDTEFVMANTLTMNAATGIASWSGEPIDIGNDAGIADGVLNVTGTNNAIIHAAVDFNSDANVNIAAGASLLLNNLVNFDSVNGVNNALITGTGTLRFSNAVNVNESTTISMAGGSVDLDGVDTLGEFIIVDAPFTINAASVLSFGRVNVGGTNTISVDNSTGTGVLTINLDNAANTWTLNPEGVLSLINDNTEATLLAGNHAILNGAVGVFGDVRSTARVTMGGTFNINTAGQPFRLGGGSTSTEPNRLTGGLVQGTGILGADTGRALHGFGTINTSIDFDGTANLKADDGTLTVTGSFVDVNVLGTADADGVLNIPAAWNNGGGAIGAVTLNGGTLTGGAITNDLATGITGFGFVESQIFNNTSIAATGSGQTLVFQTAGNNDDWDGPTNIGQLIANPNATLELRDNLGFNYFGNATVGANATLFANGFELRFDPTSNLSLASGAKYTSTNSTIFHCPIQVTAGTATIQINGTATFSAASATTLTGNLRLSSNTSVIAVGAEFSGGGSLINESGRTLRIFDGVTVGDLGATVLNDGTLALGSTGAAGQVGLASYQQSTTGAYQVEIGGSSINDYDILSATGVAQLSGNLNLSLIGGYNPAYGQVHTIVTAGSVSGTFNTVSGFSQTTQKSWLVTYLPTSVRVSTVIPGDANLDYKVNTLDFNILAGKFSQLNQGWGGADFNFDNVTNSLDFNILLSTYGFSVPAPAAQPSSLGAVVPEPGLLSMLAIPAVLLKRRRR